MPNYTLGKGQLYFDPYDPVTGLLTGERYLGNTPSVSVSIETESLSHFNSDFASIEKDEEFDTKTTRTMKMTADDITLDNLALFVKGGLATVSQVSGSVSAEAVAGIKKDRYYQLGVTPANPTGVRNISALVVRAGSSTKVLGADYTADLALGRIYIIPGGTIIDGAAVTVDYTRPAATREQISTALASGTQGALRYIADNKRGVNRDMFAPKVTLKPSGEMELKGAGENNSWATLGFDVEVLAKDAVTAALYIDGRAV